jgi:hypothetical protein
LFLVADYENDRLQKQARPDEYQQTALDYFYAYFLMDDDRSMFKVGQNALFTG